MNRKSFLICIIMLGITFPVLAQQNNDFLPNIIPPSPTAYELGKYGEIPVGMFTGTPAIDIPLSAYKSKNIEIPQKQQLSVYQKRKQKKERNLGNLIEGRFWQGKNACDLNNIYAKRSDTSQSWIGAIFFVTNLITLRKAAKQYDVFWISFKKSI